MFKKNNHQSDSNATQEYEPIVFINKPANSYAQDVVGFKSQIETISHSIENGANMIGVIANFGTGKSTISDILVSEVLKNEHQYSTIRINMWDSLSEKTDQFVNNDISDLTKSFLYQLSNGNHNTNGISKLSRYISKRMSKNFNTISFSTISTKLWKCGILATVLYALYSIFSQENIGFLSENHSVFWGIVKDFSPLFIVFATVAAIYGILDTSIAFSNWKKTNDNHLESNDVFELYDEIATVLVKNSYGNKQIVLIEDLDRIENKTSVKAFLKELYRFQNSVSGELKDKFVFIIAVKPEALLEETETEHDEHLYSKVFDVTINLKPIHFEDYESVLLAMLEKNKKSKEKLERLIGKKIEENSLPKAFNWILLGENLTLRDLKDRLNHAISIMVSLKNKNYKDVTHISFTACAAVAYLESAFPICFYKMVQQEEKLETFIRESYPIKNNFSEEKQENLIKKFHEIFSEPQSDGENTKQYDQYEEKFVNTICKLVIDNVFDDDFRMYFYTYPNNSYVKTVDEKDVCNLIKLPSVYDNFENLDEKVKRIFNSRPNSIIIDTINHLSRSEPYPLVLVLNCKLFELAAEHDFGQSLDLLCRYTLNKKTSTEKVLACLKMFNESNLKSKTEFIAAYTEHILNWFLSGEEIDEQFLELRKNIILAFHDNVILFKDLFVHENIPLITENEVSLIRSKNIMLKLINQNLIDNGSRYIFEKINENSLFEDAVAVAINIYNALIEKDEESESLGNVLLAFLSVNKIIQVTYFQIILKCVTDIEAICTYVNSVAVEELPEEYLKGLDEKAISHGLNEDILQKLKDHNLFISYLLTKTPLNQIEDINYSNDGVKNSILSACSRILKEDEQAIISLRKCIIKELETVYEMYDPLFEGEYPIITKDELNTFSEFSNAIICIDGPRLNVENCDFIWEYCNQDSRIFDESFTMFNCLFNSEYSTSIQDSNVAKKIFYALDFSKIKFSDLPEADKVTIIDFMMELLELHHADEALRCMRHIETLIPTLETIVQGSNLTTEYIDFLNEQKGYTVASIQWLESVDLEVALCPEITDQLFQRKKYVNYVIGKSLYDRALIYDTNLLSIENYFDIYKNKPCMFDVMSANQEFIQDIVKTNLYKNIENKTLIKPLFYLPQTIDMMEFIWPLLGKNEYSEYLMSIPEIATLNNSKAIKAFLCQDENMNRLGSYQLKEKIDRLLWDDHKTHKREFKRIWNQRWKNELGKLESHLL